MKTNLFCLPFAGGSKYSYGQYVKLAGPGLRVIPLDLPGRGSRFKEQLLDDIHAVVNDVYCQVKDRLNAPYALYGHSMGTVVSYLLTRKILAAGLPKPVHLFLTGRGAPSVPDDEPPRYLLPKQEFIEKLREIGGSPDEVLQDQELMVFFEPILRADFKALETYQYQELTPFDVPITVMIGTEERATLQEAWAWQKETTQPISVRQLPGKHFFIFDYPQEILRAIAQKLDGDKTGEAVPA